MTSDFADKDLASTLQSLGLTDFNEKLRDYGVTNLGEILELEISDLEELGLNRLQARRLQRVAAEAAGGTIGAPLQQVTNPCKRWGRSIASGCLPNTQTPATSQQRFPAARSSSRHDARRRSTSRVRFGSVSVTSEAGTEFEKNARDTIIAWLKDYGEEVAPKSLGILEHDCDLVMRLSRRVRVSRNG
eukprot:TRINITY_DN26052_c0_g1_i3.p1 TRINITY_DN26052_c0_g1~~TRINITY_DN26052_c0_g1_i3.p1  ORF type:complete len:188 (+),score=10.31 TRINITY_DN26052_c0_g1_i3:107-670(+)